MLRQTGAPSPESASQSERANPNGNYGQQFNVPHLSIVLEWH